MSGHSKWATIRRKKGAVDAKRGKLFSKIIKEITVAAKQGADPEGNPRLRAAIQSAKDNNMPNKNIENAVSKATSKDAAALEEIQYEGYGPGGVAILVLCLSDNRNRTVGEIRNIFTKRGANMAEAGAVSYLFNSKGVISIARDAADEDTLMELVLDAGAEDLQTEDDSYEITTDKSNYENVKKAIEEKGIPTLSAEITRIADTTIKLTGEKAQKIVKLVETLEDNDDVQHVYANFDIDMKELEDIAS
jgi:YebC/PmpR family DNA-binding regulatory protein